MEKRIRIGLWILILGLSYALFSVIMNPIKFNKEKTSIYLLLVSIKTISIELNLDIVFY